MQNYKVFVQRVGLVAVTNILIALSSFILLPLLTKNLSANDYGIWVQFNVTITLIMNTVTLGLPYGMVRFLSAEKNKNKITEDFYSITSIVLFVVLILDGLITIFLIPIANGLFGGNVEITSLLPLIVTITCLNSIFLNYFRTFQMMRIYSFFSIIQSFSILALVTYFALSKPGIYGAIVSILITNLILFLVMFLIILLEIGIKVPRFRNIKEYLSFSLPTIPGNLSYWILDSSDRYIIGILLGNAFVGFYSPGYTLGNVIIMLLAPFSLLLPAVLPKYFDNGDIEQVRTFLKYSLKYFLLIAIPAAFGLSILSKPILTILTTSEIATNGYLVTPFVALSAVIYGINSNVNQVIVLKKKTKINGSVWIFAAFSNFILNIILVPYFGILGAAMATLTSYTLTIIITLFYNYKYMKFKFDFNPIFILKSIVSSVIMSLVIIKLNPYSLLDITSTVLVAATVYLISLLILRGIKKEEFQFLKGAMRYQKR